jgi:hypothetical protein
VKRNNHGRTEPLTLQQNFNKLKSVNLIINDRETATVVAGIFFARFCERLWGKDLAQNDRFDSSFT